LPGNPIDRLKSSRIDYHYCLVLDLVNYSQGNALMPRSRQLTTQRYTVFFVPDVEAGGFTAHIPALGIVTEGETLREAKSMAKDAIKGRVAALRELGQPIPKDVCPEQVEIRA
jgi:predicted RNase H-like HicB family nuclease